jgi:hypothetical protein
MLNFQFSFIIRKHLRFITATLCRRKSLVRTAQETFDWFFCARIIALAPSKARNRVAASPRMTIENWELSIGQISFDWARVRWTPNFGVLPSSLAPCPYFAIIWILKCDTRLRPPFLAA